MAVYTNTVSSPTLSAALGSPTLGPADIVKLNEEGGNYSEGLGDLNTRIAEFYMNPGFKGDLGNASDAQIIEANKMVINSSSPNSVSLSGLGGTVALVHWELLTSALGFLKNYTITKLRFNSGGHLEIDGTTVVTSAYLGRKGLSIMFRAGTIITNLIISAAGSVATLERDCTNAFISGGGSIVCNDPTATPANLDIYNGFAKLLEGTIMIKAGAGAVIDLSKATGNFTITWEVYGDITIIAPPEDITWNEPTDAEIFAGEVTVK